MLAVVAHALNSLRPTAGWAVAKRPMDDYDHAAATKYVLQMAEGLKVRKSSGQGLRCFTTPRRQEDLVWVIAFRGDQPFIGTPASASVGPEIP